MELLESKYLYFICLLITIAYPLAQSFEKRIQLYKDFVKISISCGLMMLVFIPWDILFSYYGIWWFNPKYFIGSPIFHLPIEEWLFFLIIPYACVFIYKVLIYFFPKGLITIKIGNIIFLGFGALALYMLLLNYNRAYSLSSFGGCILTIIILTLKNPSWKTQFLQAFIVSLIPFLLINGLLTGNFTQEALVNYNPEHFSGIRITTIPLEDMFYNFSMLAMVIGGYEFMNKPGLSNQQTLEH